MRPVRKLVEAINSWLDFEVMCKREGLFSECYMAYPIGQFLSAYYKHNLTAEYLHPILAPLKAGRGDKPRIDFAVIDDNEQLVLAIETKWLSSSQTLVRDITEACAN